MLTPAISVVSAIEGIQFQTGISTGTVVGISIAILVSGLQMLSVAQHLWRGLQRRRRGRRRWHNGCNGSGGQGGGGGTMAAAAPNPMAAATQLQVTRTARPAAVQVLLFAVQGFGTHRVSNIFRSAFSYFG